MKKFLEYIKNPKSDFLLLIIAILLLNLVCYNAYTRFDLTGSKAYSLSKSSKETVRTLEQPLSVQVFFTSDLKKPYDAIYPYISDLLKEYSQSANQFFSYKFFDMTKEENEKIASDYGLQKRQIQDVKTNSVGFTQVWLGLVITYADRTETLDGIVQTAGLEYKLTTTMQKMIAETDIFSGLTDKITVTLYWPEDVKDDKIRGITEFKKELESVCSSINKKMLDSSRERPKLVLETVSPNPAALNSTIKKYNLTPMRWENFRSAQGVVISYKDRFTTLQIPVQSFIRFAGISSPIGQIPALDNLEESVAKTLRSLVAKTNEIGYVIGHSEAFLNDTQTGGAYINYVLENRYKFKEIDLTSEEIPAGLSTIMINGPKDSFKEEELYKIDQFVMKGGNVIFVVDPYFEQLPQQQNYYYSQPTYTPIETGLDKLLASYGVKVNKDYVLDEDCLKLYDQNNRESPMYYIPYLQKDNFNQDNPVTKGLTNIFMAQCASISTEEAEANKDAKVTVLAKSSPKSWLMKDSITTYPAFISVPEDKSSQHSENLAVLVEGKFKSAFDAKPASEKDAKKNEDTLTEQNHISSSLQNSRIIVLSSSRITGSFLYTLSNFMNKNVSLLDQNEFGPMSSYFVLNMFDYLSGYEDLCEMRTKNNIRQTFSVSSSVTPVIFQYFNVIGLPVIVVILGLLKLAGISSRKRAIRLKYNPDDSRETDNTKTSEEK